MALSHKAENALFKTGAIAKGVVYTLIGLFAVATVIGAANGANGPRAVVEWIGTNPFGQILLVIIGIGLLCYCSWRWYTAVTNKTDEEDDAEGIGKRIGYACSGTVYGVLAFTAFKLAMGPGGGGQGSGGGKKQDAVQWILAQPWGQFALGAVAVAVAGVAFYQAYRAFTDDHMESVNTAKMKPKEEKSFRQTGRFGLGARFIVYGVIAYFLFRAAFMSDPSQFKGTGEALSYLHDKPFGSILLALVGAGLLAHGVFMFVRARYEYK